MDGMIVVTGLRGFQSQDPDFATFVKRMPLEQCPVEDLETGDLTLPDMSETIRGRRFVNREKGIDIVLGLSKEVQDQIGLPMAGWDRVMSENEKLSRENFNLRLWKRRVLKARWWTRLLWVFTWPK